MAKKPYPFYGLLCLRTGGAVAQGAPTYQPPALHLNLWQHKDWFFLDTAFLDVGLMIDINDPAKTYELLLPWELRPEQLEDLSERLFKGGTGSVPAIFNEAWQLTNGNGQGGHVSDSTGHVLFSVVQGQSELKVGTHVHSGVKLHAISIDVGELRKKSQASTAPQAGQMYLRFRVKGVPNAFYRVGINQGDRVLLSSSQRTEIIDFRLNVRRGTPLGLEQSVKGHFVTFSKVHLFLMKSRSHDIVFEDKLFKACRSLEDEQFWASYSLQEGAGWWATKWTRWRVKRSLGYQWTKLSVEPSGKVTPITEYSILARFKNLRLSIFWFVLFALAFGAAGNGLWDAAKLRYGESAVGRFLTDAFSPPPISKGNKP